MAEKKEGEVFGKPDRIHELLKAQRRFHYQRMPGRQSGRHRGDSLCAADLSIVVAILANETCPRKGRFQVPYIYRSWYSTMLLRELNKIAQPAQLSGYD